MFCLVQNTFAILLRGDTVNTGLFQLLHAVGSASLIAAYLEGSSYDELIELNTRTRTFRSLGHVQKKYNLPLTEGTVEALDFEMRAYLVKFDCMDTPRAISFKARLERAE